ncbi:MAG: AAA family ATPase [Thermoproteota archaeon]
MRIKRVTLENIRSYESQTVNFPPGSVLLSGEVGSGKSSLLLAIEFALFGIKRGELSGESLLRRGKKEGKVRLDFTLQGKPVTVERNLTRVSSGVRQETGYIVIEGRKREGTATELKAIILDLLGYPKELVRKQKSLLYRYTVYTPQEHMKEIIQADREKRLDTLRKIFGVNRYKTIRENTEDFLRTLRSKKRELQMVYRELTHKREQKNQEEEKLQKTQQLLEDLHQRHNKVHDTLKEWKKKKQGIEEKIKAFNHYQKELGKAKTRLKNCQQQLDTLQKEEENKRNRINQLEKLKPPTHLSDQDLKETIQIFDQRRKEILQNPQDADDHAHQLWKQKEDLKQKIEETKQKRTQAHTRIQTINERIQQLIEAQDTCPVCGQRLDREHREEKISEYRADIFQLEKERGELKSQLQSLNQEVEEREKELRQYATCMVNKFDREIQKMEEKREAVRDYQEKMREKKRLQKEILEQEKRQKELTQRLQKAQAEIKNLKSELQELEGVEDKKDRIEREIEEITQQLTHIKSKIAENQTIQKISQKRLKELKQEIEKMVEAKQFQQRLAGYESWLEEYFIKLSETIEKHFMLELRRRFNPLFRDWFNLLVEDELLEVKLDDSFSPIIEQQGYQAEFENLSGGESTSVALAYRLALNKVINTLVEDITTNDLVILDEPTDGFSNDQLDKIRDIIIELDIPQTIIVSHEPKIESYVENIIKIRKEEGVSHIITP